MSKRSIQLLSPVSYRCLLTTKDAAQRVLAIDGSWYMPNSDRNALGEYKESRLPSSRFFDLDGIKDDESAYPHMLPKISAFNEAISKLGIQKTDKLIIYDRVGNFSAPRVAWTFQQFGHEDVQLLNNFPSYLKYSYPLERSQEDVEPSNYKSTEFDSNGVLSFEQFVDIVSHESKRADYNILDARSLDRFTGDAPEPRPGLPSGHAPGAKSLPFTKVLNEDNLFLKEPQLSEVFQSIGFDAEKPTIVMCGTGVTACILKAALDSIKLNKAGIQVYDGSWTEYAQRAGPELIVKGKE
jgi:thiosulfate/3-mercaptopyruvate sulfurtransferase